MCLEVSWLVLYADSSRFAPYLEKSNSWKLSIHCQVCQELLEGTWGNKVVSQGRGGVCFSDRQYSLN